MDKRIASLFEPYDPYGAHREIDEVVSRRLSAYLQPDAWAPGIDVKASTHEFTSTAIPEEPTTSPVYLDWLFERLVPRAVRVHAPRFIGHMTSALPNFVHPLERVLAALNQNVVKVETSDVFTLHERQALGMLHRLIYGFPESFYADHVQESESTLGMVVSGGTLANIAALWCARNHALAAGPAVARAGMVDAMNAAGVRRAVVVGSQLMHYSLRKAADILGIGEANLIGVRARHNGRIDVAELDATLRDCRERGDAVLAVVGIAGTTETGAVDPLADVADVAAKYGVHFHVDAAWGGPVLFSDKYRGLLAGIERADTVTIDGHKQLYLPVGLGMVFFRDPSRAKAIEKSAQYIVRTGSMDLGRRTLEGSRPAMTVFLHAALHVIGRRGYEMLMERGIARAKGFADLVRGRGEFQLLGEPDLNIVVYRLVPRALRAAIRERPLSDEENARADDVNVALQERLRRTGQSFVSRTVLSHTAAAPGKPIVSLRTVFANPLTVERDLMDSLDEQVALAAQIES